MDFSVITTGIIGILATVVSSVITYFQTRRKYNTEVDGSVIQNLNDAFKLYDKIIADNKKIFDELVARNNDLASKNKELEEKNDQLAKEIKKLREQMFSMMTNICYNLTCEYREKDFKKTIKVNEIKTKKNIQGK